MSTMSTIRLTRVLAKWDLPPRARGLLSDIALRPVPHKEVSPPRIRIESPAGVLVKLVEPGLSAREIAKALGKRAVLSPAGGV